jgi:AcrR family transcriptional regulator
MKPGERTRARILEASIRLLGREGPDGFSASALAAEAQVSKATLFHHFGTLDEIPLAALEQMWLDVLERRADSDLQLHAYLEALGREVLQTAGEHRTFLRAYFAFFTKAIFDPRFRERLSTGAEEMHAALMREIGPRLGRSRSPADAEALAYVVEMGLDGLALHLLVGRDPDRLWEGWAALARMIAAHEEAP